MSTFALKSVFDDIVKNNISINLDEDTFFHTTTLPDVNKITFNDKNIAYIYSKSDLKQVMNNLIDEGSSNIKYSYILQPIIKEEIFRKLLHSFFVKYNFYVKFFMQIESTTKKNNKIIRDFEIVITDKDVDSYFIQDWLNNKSDKEDEDEDEDEEEDDDEEEDNEDDDDEEEDEDEDNDVEDEDEDNDEEDNDVEDKDDDDKDEEDEEDEEDDEDDDKDEEDYKDNEDKIVNNEVLNILSSDNSDSSDDYSSDINISSSEDENKFLDIDSD